MHPDARAQLVKFAVADRLRQAEHVRTVRAVRDGQGAQAGLERRRDNGLGHLRGFVARRARALAWARSAKQSVPLAR